MNRRDFMKRCAWWTALLPAASSVVFGGCGSQAYDLGLYQDFEVNFQGSVLVIGAGAAGLAASYILDRYGIEHQVIEASSRFGGRVKRTTDMAEFPIDLGGEWIHTDPSVLASLIDDPSVDGSIEVIPYSPQSVSIWKDGEVRSRNWVRNYYQEYKFKRTTWYGFLERYFAPAAMSRIHFDQPVTQIDTSGPGVVVTTSNGTIFEADRVLVTVPIAVLQNDMITFNPPLTPEQTNALDRVHVPPGIKVFSRFEKSFYPDLLMNGGVLDDTSSDKLYYDAAFRKDSPDNVLGLFWVSEEARALTEKDDDAVIETVLAELDRMFDGQASRHHVQSMVQNWSAEPFIQGAYTVDFGGSHGAFTGAFAPDERRRMFFAGEAFGVDYSTVHGAMESAYESVRQMLFA